MLKNRLEMVGDLEFLPSTTNILKIMVSPQGFRRTKQSKNEASTKYKAFFKETCAVSDLGSIVCAQF